jgi:uncharacterized protein (DUF362 family)
MNTFLYIKYLLNDKIDRTVKNLSVFYDDRNILIKIIDETVNIKLSKSILCNKKILLKPNWVTHSSKNNNELCLRTHDNFLLAALEVILSKKPSAIIIGDAPIQGCRWDEVVTDTFLKRIDELSKKYEIPVQVKDFRRTSFTPEKNKLETELKPLSDYVIFDVKDKSYLEPITKKGRNEFRVTNYDPSKLEDSHRHGIHKYCITKELFEADVIISIPKIKTHQKSGITGALKNIVGLNGDKDFLPHHRFGGTGFGGDCYPGKNYIRYWSELALDRANGQQGKAAYFLWTKVASLLWRLSCPKDVHTIEAGWHGNDTTWRMVMDLNLIAYYGKPDGTLSNNKERMIFSLCDGIIAGQGDGPLRPEPLLLGVVSFTDNPAVNDIAMATLMGFNYSKFPLLTESNKLFSVNDCKIFLNSKQITIADLLELSIQTDPPKGWKLYLQE